MVGEWFKGQRTPALQPQAIEKARLALAKGIRYLKDASDTLKETQGKGRSYATINRYTDWLRHVLNWAIKQKRIRENPVLAIERKPEEEAPIFQYSVEQEAKLIEQLNAEEIDLLRLAILSGLRQGNQFPLRKERINLGHGIILIPRTKNRKPRVVHLAEETKELVRRQMARHMESPFLFPGTRNSQRSLNARWWYSKRFKPACERAGIPVVDVRQLWHALRHTFGSRLASLQYKENSIMAAGGWTSSKAVQRYVHLYDETLKNAAERLAGIKPVPITNLVLPN